MESIRTITIIKTTTNTIVLFVFVLLITSCKSAENSVRPVPVNEKGGYYYTARDGSKIFIREYIPVLNPANTVYIISGITGINHESEKEIINILSADSNRVVVVHPRGTGYSEGERGDTDPGDIIKDYCEIIQGDSSYSDKNRTIFLFGHSMSCAFAIEMAVKLPELDGLILVNPPFKLKPAKGMSPGFSDYLKYIGYYVFAPHTPVVNMAGDPALIADETDRLESEQRNSDPLLVKYFSMRSMSASKKIMDAMAENAKLVNLPLLLLYGENDNIVDKSGCDEIYAAWKGKNKSYLIIKGGSHGKSTVVKDAEIIIKWIAGI